MSDTIFIEEYRGAKITYSVYGDKFHAEGLHDGNKKFGWSRASLQELREAIDKQQEKAVKKKFKPVEAYFVKHNEVRDITITAIRADNGIQVKDDERTWKVSGSYEYRNLIKKTAKNEKVIKEISDLRAQIKSLEEAVDKKEKSLERFDVEKMIEDFYAEETED